MVTLKWNQACRVVQVRKVLDLSASLFVPDNPDRIYLDTYGESDVICYSDAKASKNANELTFLSHLGVAFIWFSFLPQLFSFAVIVVYTSCTQRRGILFFSRLWLTSSRRAKQRRVEEDVPPSKCNLQTTREPRSVRLPPLVESPHWRTSHLSPLSPLSILFSPVLKLILRVNASEWGLLPRDREMQAIRKLGENYYRIIYWESKMKLYLCDVYILITKRLTFLLLYISAWVRLPSK